MSDYSDPALSRVYPGFLLGHEQPCALRWDLDCWSVALGPAHPETPCGPLCAALVPTSGLLRVGLLLSPRPPLPFRWMPGPGAGLYPPDVVGGPVQQASRSPGSSWPPSACKWSSSASGQDRGPLAVLAGQARRRSLALVPPNHSGYLHPCPSPDP